ncbi:MAG: glutamate synthase subunit alpha, partial [Saccharofermentans sp.]|nr:glutamate synthase subunit alpha [Saccharofermentans sp.]
MRPYERKYLNECYQGIAEEHDACGIGLVVNIDGRKEYRTLDDALSIVEKLEHRAGKDASGEVGDGVGILVQISHKFFAKAAKKAGIEVKEEGDYGVGMFFLPQDTKKRTLAMRMFKVICTKNGLNVIGWREVPTEPDILGKVARDAMPVIMQCFVERPEDCTKGLAFDRMLYVARREFEQSTDDTYITSLSSRTIVYKGMFLVGQLRKFYKDMQSKDYETAIAMVHSRFS